jgi:hypothetical protein
MSEGLEIEFDDKNKRIGILIAIMAAVRPESRSFAIGLGTLIVHALGDVPAPPIMLTSSISTDLSTPNTTSGSM